jgi:hypothetical protein
MKKILFSITHFLFIVTVATFPITTLSVSPVVNDPANLAVNIKSSISNAITTVQQGFIAGKEYGLDAVAYMLAQKIQEKTGGALINKVTGALGSTSALVGDFNQYMNNLGITQNELILTGIRDLSQNAAGGQNPFAGQIARSFVQNRGERTLQDTLKNTLIDPTAATGGAVGQRIAKFANEQEFNTFLQTGQVPEGVDAYGALFGLYSNPVNTAIGSQITAISASSEAIRRATETARTELQSPGVLPGRRCRNEVPLDARLGAESRTYCADWVTETPVGAINDTLNKALTGPIDRLNMSDEFSEMLGGVLNGMITKFTNRGLTALGGAVNNTVRRVIGGPEDTNQANDPITGNNRTDVPDRIIDLEVEIEVGLERSNEAFDALEEVLVFLMLTPELTHKLDRCIPGPDFGWEKRLDDYIDRQSRKTERKAIKTNATGDANENAINKLDAEVEEAKQSMKTALFNNGRNMPGATTMRFEVEKMEGKIALTKEYQDRQVVISRVRGTLENIKSQAITSNARFAGEALILFTDQWEALSGAQKINRLETAINAGFIGARFDPTTGLALPSVTRQALDDTVNGPTLVAELAPSYIAFQWDIWNAILTDENSPLIVNNTADYRNGLRVLFDGITQQVPTPAEVTRLQSNITLFAEENIRLENYFGACTLIRNGLANQIGGVTGKPFVDVFNSTAPTSATVLSNLTTFIESSTEPESIKKIASDFLVGESILSQGVSVAQTQIEDDPDIILISGNINNTQESSWINSSGFQETIGGQTQFVNILGNATQFRGVNQSNVNLSSFDYEFTFTTTGGGGTNKLFLWGEGDEGRRIEITGGNPNGHFTEIKVIIDSEPEDITEVYDYMTISRNTGEITLFNEESNQGIPSSTNRYGNAYQVPPHRNIYQLLALDQGSMAFCGLTTYLQTYHNGFRVRGNSIKCSPVSITGTVPQFNPEGSEKFDNWYDSTLTDYLVRMNPYAQ